MGVGRLTHTMHGHSVSSIYRRLRPKTGSNPGMASQAAQWILIQTLEVSSRLIFITKYQRFINWLGGLKTWPQYLATYESWADLVACSDE